MGSAVSGNSSGANRMAIAAMANVVNFTKEELLDLQIKFRDLAGTVLVS